MYGSLFIGIAIWASIAGAICLLKKNNGLVDIFWGLGFLVVSWATSGFPFNSAGIFTISFTLNALVWIWGFRLSAYLFYRNWGKPEDFRYANWRKEWGKNAWWRSILQVYLLQSVILFIISIPVWWSNTHEALPDGFLQENQLVFQFIFSGIGLLGIVIQAIADFQKYKFKVIPENRGKVLDTGLWKYSRHPNYFGEILMWSGVGALGLFFEYGWVGLIGPIGITFLLYRVSGAPMLEEKYKNDPEHQKYMAKTPKIIPFL